MPTGDILTIPNVPAEIISGGLTGFFILFLVGYAVVAAVLVYHWQKYGGRTRRIFIVETLFITVSVLFSAIAFFAIP